MVVLGKIASKPSSGKAITTNTQSSKISPAVTTNSYISPHWNIAFDYPSTWTLSDNSKEHNYDTSTDVDHLLVKSPSGFKLYFNTYLTDGIGGACGPDGPSKIANIKIHGESDLNGIYAVSYSDENDSSSFYLHLSKDATNKDLQDDCLFRYTVVTPLSLGIKNSKGEVVSIILNFDSLGINQTSQQKPNDKEYNEAVNILKSVHKI